MATDGVKIIDGDLARDTYEGIMDLYDSDAEIETIRKEFAFVKEDYGEASDFYHEIFVTAYALAFWEIGEITEQILDELGRVIALKAGVRFWTEQVDEAEGKKRQKELNRLKNKVSSPNLKIRKRKKYRSVKNLYFHPDDLLAFRLSNGNYHAVICAKVTQQRGQCTYDLVATTYQGKTRPTEEDLVECSIAGRRIGSGCDPKATLSIQPRVNEIWRFYKSESNFFFGLPYHLVTHKDMINLKDKFEKVGKLKIVEAFKKDASYGYESSFEGFESIFRDLNNHMSVFGEERFPVRLLCDL